MHTTFDDGVELVEEYDAQTHALLERKWKAKTMMGGVWEHEIGIPLRPAETTTQQQQPLNIGLTTSAQNPIFMCLDTSKAWEWRIRNIPYPKDVYQLSLDKEKADVVLRTTNRKYHKRFKIPSMIRMNLALNDNALSYSYANNTLIIQYEKPDSILASEAHAREALKKCQKDGDVECNQQ